MRQIDFKYKTSGDITKMDGTPIPPDEPLVLFRAKDKLLPALLVQYRQLCQDAGSPQQQVEAVDELIKSVETWQEQNQDKVKIPD
jgi:hypothetical protein